MEKPEDIRQRIKELFDSQNLAVLATHNAGQPYASLVAFVASEDLKQIHFVTPKTTRKFANLSKDHRVAVLVNSSINQADDFHQAISVTAVGNAEIITGAEREQIHKQYLTKHPYLADFVKSPSCALVRVTPRAYYMVKNFQIVMELHINP